MARVHRTYWIVRRRYRRVGYAGALIGAAICAIYLVPNVYSAQKAVPTEPVDWVTSLIIVAVAVLVPPILARLLWLMHRGRYFSDMYHITLR